jgi:hypothetical protein
MVLKISAKGVPMTIEDIMFTDQRTGQRKNGCSSCVKKGHFMEDCPNIPTLKAKKARRPSPHHNQERVYCCTHGTIEM